LDAALKGGGPVLFASSEPVKAVIARLVLRRAGITLDQVFQARFTEDDFHALTNAVMTVKTSGLLVESPVEQPQSATPDSLAAFDAPVPVAQEQAAKEAADFEEAIQRAEEEIALIQARPLPTLSDQESAVWDIQRVLDDLGHEDDPRIKKMLELVTKGEAYLVDLEEEASHDSLDLDPVEMKPLPILATVPKAASAGGSSDPVTERGLVQHVLDLGAGGELRAVGVIVGIIIMVLSLGYTKDPALLLAFSAIFGGLLFIPGMILIVAQSVARAFRRGKPCVTHRYGE